MAAPRRRTTRKPRSSFARGVMATRATTSAITSVTTSTTTSATTSIGRDAVTLSVTSTTALTPMTAASRPSPRATYRNLLRRGLAPDEAANLTAFLFGIPVGAHHWEIKEIDRLLFLRELTVAGRFEQRDGAPEVPPR